MISAVVLFDAGVEDEGKIRNEQRGVVRAGVDGRRPPLLI